jgi:tetratricopeptide (TPR) repeat protein
MAPEEAARLLGRRPTRVCATLLAALDHWLILANSEKAPETGWLKQVLALADSDPWRQSVRLAREKNDRQALEKLAREADTAVQPAEALYVLERGLRQRGAITAALALLRRAQQTSPADFWINHNLGTALRDSQPPQYEEAIRFLTVAAALRPDSPGARLNLGLALARTGRLDEAVVAYRQTIALKADYSAAHYDLGLVLDGQGHLDEAIGAFRRAIELTPDYADAQYQLGDALLRAGRPDEAVPAFRKAIALKPDHAESHCDLGIALWKLAKLAPALSSLERGHELGSRRKDWPHSSAQWVRDCREQLELDRRERTRADAGR